MENKITILNQKNNCGLSIRPFILVKIFDFVYGRPMDKFLDDIN